MYMRHKSIKQREFLVLITSNKGVALLMVLWVMTILMVVVLSFSFMTRTDAHSTLFFKEGTEKRFLAEAGIQRGIMETLRRGIYKNKQVVMEGSEAIKVDGTSYTGQLGNDYYTFEVVDESGKINLNILTDSSGIIVNNLLLNLGVSKKDADTIVDSILDWKDADELHRLNGAESDFYMSLPSPYKSKNNNLDAVEELLMVKAITPEILYGSNKKAGFFDFLTVYSKTGGINVNTAPTEVLSALPGMTPELVNRINSFRKSAEIKTLQDLESIVGMSLPLISPFIGVSESNTYTIRATGYKKGEKQGFTIMATVIIENNGKYRCVYYKSPAKARQRQE
jgi:general secretion pathway protein K